MTMPTNTTPTAVNAVQRIELPKAGYPMLTRMVSDQLFPPDVPGAKEEPITWAIGNPHPLVPELKVVRMFVVGGGVRIYSATADGRGGMRNFVPMARVRLTEEAMPLDVFVDELEADEDDNESVDPEPEPPAPQPANGQPAPAAS